MAGVAAAALGHGLTPRGAYWPDPADGLPATLGTLVLLGPREPGFWPIFQASPEYRDKSPDPLDRWSSRVIGALAAHLGATPFFPFGGAPFAPFTRWARRCGASLSPVGLLVHETAGLLVSYRGALGFSARLDLPPIGPDPCPSCAAPCRTACPVDALNAAGYDLARCHAYLDTGPGQDCLANGCAVRRACPVQDIPPPPGRSAFHMAAFHESQTR